MGGMLSLRPDHTPKRDREAGQARRHASAPTQEVTEALLLRVKIPALAPLALASPHATTAAMRTATSGATAPKGGGQRAACAACADESPLRLPFLPFHRYHSGRSGIRGLAPVSSVIWSTVTLPAEPRHEKTHVPVHCLSEAGQRWPPGGALPPRHRGRYPLPGQRGHPVAGDARRFPGHSRE